MKLQTKIELVKMVIIGLSLDIAFLAGILLGWWQAAGHLP